MLSDTLEIKDISQEEIKKVFDEKSGEQPEATSDKRVVTMKKPAQIEKMRRPTFDLPENYHQKLRMICAAEGEDVGKTLTKVVMDWLDGIKLSL